MFLRLRSANEKKAPQIYRPEEHQNESALNRRHPIYRAYTVREFNFLKANVDNVVPASILIPNVANLTNFVNAINACNVILPIWLAGVDRPVTADDVLRGIVASVIARVGRTQNYAKIVCGKIVAPNTEAEHAALVMAYAMMSADNFFQSVSAAAGAGAPAAGAPVLFPIGRLFVVTNSRTLAATRLNAPAPPGGLPWLFD